MAAQSGQSFQRRPAWLGVFSTREMRVCYRRAVPSDIARWWPTVRAEWGLFSAPLVRRVPSLIAELVASIV